MSSQRDPSPTGRSARGPRELIVIAKAQPDAAPRLSSEAPNAVDAFAALPALLTPLFGAAESRTQLEAAELAAAGAPDVPDLSVYYRAEAPDDQLEAVAEALRADPRVEAAYIKPAAELPDREIERPSARADAAPPATPDFTSRQGYLGAAPGGVDARYAWTLPGGRGANVRIIDVEGAWRFSHEDLLQNQGGVIGGEPSTDLGWRNHGTAVVGEFGGDDNGRGVAGLCPEANVRAVSIFGNGMGSAAAIRNAANALRAGDLLLIELHRPGPRFAFAGRPDQRGYIAVEWWPDDYDAIRYATSRGVVVVEAAGNGAENLDDPIYDQRPAGFPATWTNPFRRGARDSGAIIVGAGAPPPGTHGRDHGPDRSRLGFSNFGALVDAQGWGREVTTTGYGDLQGGPSEDVWYTDQFSGTSSASPIVVGTLGCLQGILRARGVAPLSPSGARALLRATGSPQVDAPGRPAAQRIGGRPNLRELIARALPSGVTVTALHRYWNSGIGDHFYTTNWGELGGGRAGWAYEGVQCYVQARQAPGTVPLYRYWNSGIGDHFYTTNWGELGGGRNGWAYEGVQCYVYPGRVAGTVPLYRYWNPGIGDHFYTTSWSELGGGRNGWGYEGIQCYVAAQPGARPEAPSDDEGTAAFELAPWAPTAGSLAAAAGVFPPPLSPPTTMATFAPPLGARAPEDPALPPSFATSRDLASELRTSAPGSVTIHLDLSGRSSR
jgi:Subtilase family/Repeat of unknown function (DUF5648)